jgi:UDP-glucose-4-epimerase GalE
MANNETILVIGGAGYIGSHTARCLRSHGHPVRILDNLCTGYEQLAAGFPLIRGDADDVDTLRRAFAGVRAVMFFAAHAYVGESVENPRKYFGNNVQTGLTVLNACLDNGVRAFVFSSTCAVYGVPARVPITESSPRDPINPYGITKMIFERALEAYAPAYGLRYASLRYFNAAGADESGELGEMHDPETHLIPLALDAAAGRAPTLNVFGDDYPTPDGTCVRDYIHVNDLAEAHVAALHLLLQGQPSLTVNLGTGTGCSVRQILEAVERVTGRAVPHTIAPRRPGDPAELVADPALAAKLLQWKATRGLDEIVRTAWNWHQKRPR